MKKYNYNSKRYLFKVLIPAWIGGFVAIYSLLKIITSSSGWYWWAGFAVGLYTFWEVYISLSNPSSIEISDKEISFISFQKKHTYRFSEIKSFKVKEFHLVRKVFVRINNPGYLKGRYWVNCLQFNDTEELYQTFRDLEYKLDPNGLKARIRKGNEKKR